ncbi:hypothetical protein JK358_37930 [Nocardia sp. 2]|uniref:DUF5753 domain-containing protein n=1 Tax=Nocardia acididurans TaxID=2802282 RepID=A0ABS1MJG5_9NOCA|nr:Scr1 family TA system antitoxin-like transcriptional regulator [Nocardia acididurans]MBL1080190.1 hypothetical protein [Nocardia acididurans]
MILPALLQIADYRRALDLAGNPSLSRVIPFSAGAHPGLTMQTFDWLQFPSGTSGLTLPTVVYAEGAIGSVFHEHDDEVNRYRQAIEAIRAVALGQQDTKDLVLKIAKEFGA